MRNDGDVRAALAFMADVEFGPAVFQRVFGALEKCAPEDLLVRTTRSQVAFWRRRGFAYLWLPGQYLENPRTPVSISFALPEREPSPRIAQIVQSAKNIWMHHVDIADADDVDAEVLEWLRRAADYAG